MADRVLVLELNELCPPLMARFIADGRLPNFARLRDESLTYVTDAEESGDRLQPWVQWVTVHTGVGPDIHGALSLGQGGRARVPSVADVVGRADRDVWLCSPMNVIPQDPVRGVFLPDPWSVDAEPTPPELTDFFRFVRANVQEHSNPAARLSARQVLAFIRFILRRGLRASTVVATARQLVDERIGSSARWKRAALLDRFQWDVFRWYLARQQPAFATFFSNSTAHLQHHHWRHMEPELFDPPPAVDELRKFGGAIRYGYEQMDRIVGEALGLAGDNVTLVLCTALSQQAYARGNERGRKTFHRPYDFEAFAAALHLPGVKDVAPVMAEQFRLYFDSASSAAAAAEVLEHAHIAGAPAFAVELRGDEIFTGSAFFDPVPHDAMLELPSQERSIPFGDVFYASATGQSGMHNPDGLFWIRPPGGVPGGDGGRVPLRAVAPTLLGLLGLSAPAAMSEAPVGAANDRPHRRQA